jgi:hypothetical protein
MNAAPQPLPPRPGTIHAGALTGHNPHRADDAPDHRMVDATPERGGPAMTGGKRSLVVMARAMCRGDGPSQMCQTPEETSYLHEALFAWKPGSRTVAREFAMECVMRAEALARVLQEYTWGAEDFCRVDVHLVAALLEDLMSQAFSLMPDGWAGEEDLQRAGWTPPPHRDAATSPMGEEELR